MAGKKGGNRDLFEAALREEGTTGRLADLARSVYFQESSGGKNTQTSNAGAVGGMQIIPTTFKGVADAGWDINDPLHNARAGIRYLKQLDKQSGGNSALTAAGYYGGPVGLEKARKGIAVSDPRNPNAPNTLEYGEAVARRMGEGTTLPRTQAPAGGTPARTEPVQVAQSPQGITDALKSFGSGALVNQYQASNAAPVAVAPGPMPVEQVAQAAPVPQVDSWGQFLQGLQGQAKVPVTAEALNFAMPTMVAPQFAEAAAIPQSRVPDFRAFKAWGARV